MGGRHPKGHVVLDLLLLLLLAVWFIAVPGYVRACEMLTRAQQTVP